MNFDNGVKFSLDVITPDTISAATMASLLNAAASVQESEWHGCGEAGHRQHHHQFQRWHAGRALCFLRQPVLQSPAIESVPVGRAVVYLGLVRLGVQVTAPWASILTRSDP